MKKFKLVAMLLFFGAFTNAQNGFHNKTIEVLPQSTLTIVGDTNINSFECGFDTVHLKETQNISYSKEDSVLHFKDGILSLETRGFDCGNKGINKDFHGLVKTREHPQILLELNRIELSSPSKGIANVCITIAGIQNFYDVPVSITNGNISRFKGKMELDIKDYNLEAPTKLFGAIVVKDEIEIDFDLKVKK